MKRNLASLDSPVSPIGFSDKTVAVRVFEILQDGEKVHCSDENVLYETIRKENVWKEAFLVSKISFAKGVGDIRTFAELNSAIAPDRETDYYLDIYFSVKYHASKLLFLSLLTMGLIPTWEGYQSEMTLKLYSKDKQIIAESQAKDDLTFTVSSIPYNQKWIVATLPNINNNIYPELLKHSLRALFKGHGL
ncbi:MAG: hypothetical protein HYV97_18755 [Bdellovibrio sp.]|nr:hypothetical protein [Bdellovibrio sp.]